MKTSFKFVKSSDWDDPVKEKAYFNLPDDWMEPLQEQADLLSKTLDGMDEEEGLRYLAFSQYKFSVVAPNSVEITLEN